MKTKQLFTSMAPPLISKTKPQVPDMKWSDVTGIAIGTGFTIKVAVSIALSDALQSIANETDSDNDQRLWDVLWLAHFQLSLDESESATFNYTFPHKHWKTEEITEVSLRLHGEVRNDQTYLSLLEDF